MTHSGLLAHPQHLPDGFRGWHVLWVPPGEHMAPLGLLTYMMDPLHMLTASACIPSRTVCSSNSGISSLLTWAKPTFSRLRKALIPGILARILFPGSHGSAPMSTNSAPPVLHFSAFERVPARSSSGPASFSQLFGMWSLSSLVSLMPQQGYAGVYL